MDHREASEALWEYRDGELPARRRGEVEEHLSACAECRGELAAWEAAAKAFFASSPAPSPFETEAFAARAMARVGRGRRLAALRWLVPVLGAGLAVALALPGLRAVPDPAQAMILGQKGGGRFWSFLDQAPPSTREQALAFVEGQR